MKRKKILIFLLSFFAVLLVLGAVAFGVIYYSYSKDLPDVNTIEDYNPKEVSRVYDRNGEVIGEFFDVEKRKMVSSEEIPDFVEQAFMAAEDSDFYSHGGINYTAIMRAAIKNFMAGRTVQGGSTITQQVVKKIFLSDERSIDRKIKEAILSWRLESIYDKDQILNLYLNHIYLGEGAYGVEMAAQTYFRKGAQDLEIKEAAMLAGLTNRPGKNSPLQNALAAKRRQRYVLFRMAEEGYIKREEAEKAVAEKLKVYFPKKLEKHAPYFVETLRQVLTEKIGSRALLQDGLKITTSLDLEMQKHAQKAVKKGLRELDKRQGYRGAKENLRQAEQVKDFLQKSRNQQIKDYYQYIEIDESGEIVGKLKDPLNLSIYQIGSEQEKKANLPEYLKTGDITEAIVTKVSNREGLVFVRFGEYRGLVPFESMTWARKPNPELHHSYDKLKRPSDALSKGDIIQVKIVSEKVADAEILKTKLVEDIESYVLLELEQEPQVQGALLSFDQKSGDIVAMVGGYNYEKSKYNRTYQALRQTGSSFKPLVYSAALDYGYMPTSEILDIPMVFEEEVPPEESKEPGAEATIRKYKPSNHSRDFSGDVLFRDALVRSMNVPTMQIINKIGVPWALNYSYRLGIFSDLNEDITLALGSSGVTLYELTKAFSVFGRMGKSMTPLLIRSVEKEDGESVLTDYSFDEKFKSKILEKKKYFYRNVFENLKFGDQSEVFSYKEPEGEEKEADLENNLLKEEQVISPQTAYIMTNILSDVIYGSRGTGARARVLRRPAAGKTGTTSAYYDAWFMGYTPQLVTGVWVGFDQERTIGKSETGSSAALPIWTDYMLGAHDGLPKREFEVPKGIVFSNIDLETGHLAGPNTKRVSRQAFREDSLPKDGGPIKKEVEEKDLFEEDFL